MLSVCLQITILLTQWSTKSTWWSTKSTQFKPCSTRSLSQFVPRLTWSSTVEKIDLIPPHHRSLCEENETWPHPVEEWFPPVPKFWLQVVWMIESVFSTVWIKSIFYTVDDRGTNRVDFHKIESMHSTSDDWVECGTNQVDFVDHRVDIITICRYTDSSFWINNFETNGPPYIFDPWNWAKENFSLVSWKVRYATK